MRLDPEVVGSFDDPSYHDTLAALRRDDPVHRYRDGSWLVTRYDDVRAISRDPARFSSASGVLMDDPARHGIEIEGSILHMDPPRHGPWRAVVARDFTPRAVAGFEPRLRELAHDLLAPLAPGDEVDLVAAVTAPYPVLVIAELLGVADGDRDDFRRWSDACIEDGGRGPDARRDMAELGAFLGAHAAARRTAPRDDLATKLVQAEVEGCPLGDGAVLIYLLALLVAGNETTRHLLSGTVAALSEHPDQRARLAGGDADLGLAVEEGLRWVTPIQAFGRTTTEDVVIGGVEVPAGDWVVLSYASANRDESVFGPTAAAFDVTRVVPPTHLAFGFGEHLCLGAALARLEAKVLLEELLARFPSIEVVGEPTWVRSTLVRGMRTLPVRL